MAPPLIASLRQRMLKAFELGDDSDRLALGQSYLWYSLASESAHGKLSEEHLRYSHQDLATMLTSVEVLSFPILSRCQQLAGLELREPIARIAREPSFIHSLTAGANAMAPADLQAGDLVLAAGNEIAQVIRMEQGRFGNKAVSVRHLTRPLVESIPQTSYPALVAQLLCPNDRLQEFLVRLARASGDLDKIRTVSLLLPSAVAAELRDEFGRLTNTEALQLLRRLD
ncbi:MAG: hypothetical protein ACHQQS_13075 [Thermoanaerobaculales bacterium]